MLGPIIKVVGYASFASNVYTGVIVAKGTYKLYKKYQDVQEEAISAKEFKNSFIQKHIEKFGKEPEEELVELALSTANLKENALKDSFEKVTSCVKGKLKSIAEGAEYFADEINKKAVEIEQASKDSNENS